MTSFINPKTGQFVNPYANQSSSMLSWLTGYKPKFNPQLLEFAKTNNVDIGDFSNMSQAAKSDLELDLFDWYEHSNPNLNTDQLQSMVDTSMTNMGNQTTGLFNMSADTANMLGGIANLGSSLAQGYLGFKSLGLAEDQFDMQKQAMQDQKQLTKAQYDQRRNAQIANTGSTTMPDLQWT